MRFRCQQFAVLVFLVLWPVASAVTPAIASGEAVLAASESAENGTVTIFSDVAGMLEGYGRPTVFRLTFEPTGGVGPEDLPTPFIAYVESGTFVHRDPSGAYTDVEVGTVITTERGDDYAIRNQTRMPATLLVMSLPGSCYHSPDRACEISFLPWDILCDTPCRPDITNTLLFNHQNLTLQYLHVFYTFQYVAVGSGEEYTPVDPGGDGETIYLLMRVDDGTVRTSTGESYTAGQEFVVTPGQTLVATGSEGVELFLLRVAKET